MSAPTTAILFQLVNDLRHVLLDLYNNPYPALQNPPGLKKRASVALILRIQPQYSHWPPNADSSNFEQDTDPRKRLEAFFDQDWVKYGDPEALFIKRTSRKGDRWAGHIALPGGGRDPEDEDDGAAAIRETLEEVGIDLTEQNAMAVGNLPQRLVTTSWGKVPLVVLCPYIFLLTRSALPALRLQPTEIASTHWVPLRALLSPSLRTYEYQDVSNRLAKQEFGIKRWFLRAMLGQMLFSAIRLVPSESLYCSTIDGFIPDLPKSSFDALRIAKRPFDAEPRRTVGTDKPLLLWGLTLGVLADFLEFLPPHNALKIWTYPTFSPPDVRFIIWALSYRFRKWKQRETSLTSAEAPATIELGLDAMPTPQFSLYDKFQQGKPPEGGISGLGTGSYLGRRRRRGSRSSAVGRMLEGYYDIVRKGVALALVGRSALILCVAILLWRRLKGSRKAFQLRYTPNAD